MELVINVMNSTLYTIDNNYLVTVEYEAIGNHNFDVSLHDFVSDFRVISVKSIDGKNIDRSKWNDKGQIFAFAKDAYQQNAYL